jgi:curved DNA-binding protein CbpA
VHAAVDPYAVLGVARGADQAEIHAAYRDAVRRTHPDAGGSAAAFEAVQEAYEALRDPATRRVWDAEAPRQRAARPSAATPGSASSAMEDLLAESRRLEDEARRLAGLPPRDRATASPAGESGDSVAAILRDAGQQLRDVANEGARELRRRLRRAL